jgi:hypothetical protein
MHAAIDLKVHLGWAARAQQVAMRAMLSRKLRRIQNRIAAVSIQPAVGLERDSRVWKYCAAFESEVAECKHLIAGGRRCAQDI